MVFVESNDVVSKFLDEWNSEPSLVIPVWSDLHRHPITNHISFLYIRNAKSTYILGYNHTDCVAMNINLYGSEQNKWVYDKKAFLHSGINIQNLHDIRDGYSFGKTEFVSLDMSKLPILRTYLANGLESFVLDFIPIVKVCECLDTMYLDLPFDFPNSWINSTAIPVMASVESYGICVDYNVFKNAFEYPMDFITDGRIYSTYNLYTATSRPTNTHGGINLSALKKSGIQRKAFVPKQGYVFINMDYEAYHVRIISKFIKFKLPDVNVHEWLSDQYGLPLDEGKKVTFRMLYGDIDDQYKDIEFFSKIQSFINSLWKRSVAKGYIETKYRKLKIDPARLNTPQKLFSYFVQMLETDLNIDTMKIVLEHIKNTDIELNLYVYDSFLFSVPVDSIDDVHSIKDILERNGFPVKISAGYNYHEL